MDSVDTNFDFNRLNRRVNIYDNSKISRYEKPLFSVIDPGTCYSGKQSGRSKKKCCAMPSGL
jgi:hypothetical protein